MVSDFLFHSLIPSALLKGADYGMEDEVTLFFLDTPLIYVTVQLLLLINKESIKLLTRAPYAPYCDNYNPIAIKLLQFT